jgi:hypothetical protein
MSRGPGRQQRGIIAALDVAPAVHLHDLLGDRYTRSQYVALYRAARTLEGKGLIGMFEFWDVGPQRRTYVLHRPNHPIEVMTVGLTCTGDNNGWIRERNW